MGTWQGIRKDRVIGEVQADGQQEAMQKIIVTCGLTSYFDLFMVYVKEKETV